MINKKRTAGAAIAVAMAACVLCCAAVWAPSSRASDASGSSYCPDLSSRDYSLPMRSFPPVHQVPQEGEFPFGPPRMSLSSLSGPVQAGKGSLGFRVETSRISPVERRLDWGIRLDVVRVSARGVHQDTIAERHMELSYSQEVGREEARLGVPVGGHPGFYRIDISIENSVGVTLGSYSEYVRVVTPTVNVRLVLGGERFQSGDVVRGRIQNRGPVAFSYMPRELQLERLRQSRWRAVPEEPAWRDLVARSVLLPGGAVGSCYGMRLPDGLDPGTYRVSQPISARPRSLTLRAVFRVG
jgi:hypothetical protein